MSQRFDHDQKKLLAAVLDEPIPPNQDTHLPGAGQLGLADTIDEALDGTPDMRAAITQGLAALGGFPELSAPDRPGRLAELAQGHPAFVPSVTFHAYAAYYHHPRVLAGLGMEARPPFPDGYEVESDDLTLLDAVRGRPKLYRVV